MNQAYQDPIVAPPVTVDADRGVRMIAGYKLVRGGVSLVAGLVLALCARLGWTAGIHDTIDRVRAHWTSGVAIEVADLVMSALDAKYIWISVGGLLLDGCLTTLEGFALVRGYSWGPWLVVIATALFLPFEAVAWFHQPTFGRALIFVLNAAVAGYLALRVRARRPLPAT
ncbi:MAG: DUF2127 domain-containing protein [Polyangiales bacterium]